MSEKKAKYEGIHADGGCEEPHDVTPLTLIHLPPNVNMKPTHLVEGEAGGYRGQPACPLYLKLSVSDGGNLLLVVGDFGSRGGG